MVACINPIIIRLPEGSKNQFDEHQYQGIFDTDQISDRLILKVLPEDYNAAHPVNIETKLGYVSPYTQTTYNLYQLEAVDNDRRSDVKRYAICQLLKNGGNLSVYDIPLNTSSCHPPLIAIEDYHELDNLEDKLLGFTLRIGILSVESLKGSYRKQGTKHNYNRGCRIIFTHTHNIVDGELKVYVPQY
jgi:hypothetical protein